MPDPKPHVVLYVEDNPTNVLLIERVLGLRPEWSLVSAGTGSLGIQLAAGHRPALVLLDHRLPDISGIEVLKSIRSEPALARTPVVFLSGDPSSRLPPDLQNDDLVSHLSKPVDIDEILAVLDRCRPQSQE